MFIGRMLYLLLETSPTQSGARIIDQNVYMLFDVENLRNYTPVIGDHRTRDFLEQRYAIVYSIEWKSESIGWRRKTLNAPRNSDNVQT